MAKTVVQLQTASCEGRQHDFYVRTGFAFSLSCDFLLLVGTYTGEGVDGSLGGGEWVSFPTRPPGKERVREKQPATYGRCDAATADCKNSRHLKQSPHPKND
jgi:hypothetical protein